MHLLELAVTYPQKDFSGKEVAVSQPWLMVHEPVDLMFDSWYPTDFLSANLRHTVSALFSHPAKDENPRRRLYPSGGDGTVAIPQSMEIDRLSDDEVPPPSPSTILNLTLDTTEDTNHNQARDGIAYTAPLAITGPSYSGSLVPATSGDLVPMTRRQRQRQPKGELSLGQTESGDPNDEGEPKRAVINVNESIVTLLLRLHSKYSGRPDSYVPKKQRASGLSDEYASSRIGDGSFFVEKVLDKICDIDEICAENVAASRQALWPDYHEDEAKKDAERERLEAEAKKRKARERQKQMMEQLAQQRKKFAANIKATEEASKETKTSSEKSKEEQEPTVEPPKSTEYTCCHCLVQGPATESKPIGLVILFQSSSVLAHKHESTNHLILPTTDEEETNLPPSWSDSLGLQYDELFNEMNKVYDPQSCLMSTHRGWKGGIHIQSCGHHMHYDCRTSYCQTLRNQNLTRNTRDMPPMDFERDEFICPMCRQVANALLPVPADPPHYPLSTGLTTDLALKIHGLLNERPMMSDGPSALKNEMSNIIRLFVNTATPAGTGSTYPENAAMFISSIARTNLECDIVQRGGTLVQGRGFAEMVAASGATASASTASSAEPSTSTGATPRTARSTTFESNRNKFCFGKKNPCYFFKKYDILIPFLSYSSFDACVSNPYEVLDGLIIIFNRRSSNYSLRTMGQVDLSMEQRFL